MISRVKEKENLSQYVLLFIKRLSESFRFNGFIFFLMSSVVELTSSISLSLLLQYKFLIF